MKAILAGRSASIGIADAPAGDARVPPEQEIRLGRAEAGRRHLVEHAGEAEAAPGEEGDHRLGPRLAVIEVDEGELAIDEVDPLQRTRSPPALSIPRPGRRSSVAPGR